LAGIPEHPPKSLVHGDFYPSNVMVTDDLDVSGVLDFSPMTIVGDSRVDVAGSLMWLEVVAGAGPADTDTLRQLIVQRYGQQIKPMLDFYRIVYSLYFAGARDADPKLYRWCVKNLQRWQDQQRRGSQPSHSPHLRHRRPQPWHHSAIVHGCLPLADRRPPPPDVLLVDAHGRN